MGSNKKKGNQKDKYRLKEIKFFIPFLLVTLVGCQQIEVLDHQIKRLKTTPTNQLLDEKIKC